jgi:hypothetical protein
LITSWSFLIIIFHIICTITIVFFIVDWVKSFTDDDLVYIHIYIFQNVQNDNDTSTYIYIYIYIYEHENIWIWICRYVFFYLTIKIKSTITYICKSVYIFKYICMNHCHCCTRMLIMTTKYRKWHGHHLTL